MPVVKLQRPEAAPKEAAEKLDKFAKSSPQALKRIRIFNGLNGTSKLVPFPKPSAAEFFRSL